jgi:4a-hydroxytetrahydrobiopterin dehydratase
MSFSRAPLDEAAIRVALERLPLWSFREGMLQREYRFADFVQAFGFLSSAALVAESMNHHPDWSNSYDRVTVRLVTHDAGAVTELDLELARRMEAIAAPRVAPPRAGA